MEFLIESITLYVNKTHWEMHESYYFRSLIKNKIDYQLRISSMKKANVATFTLRTNTGNLFVVDKIDQS